MRISALLPVFLCFTLLLASSPSDYLYPGESEGAISLQETIISGERHILVSFGGKPTFLFYGEAPISDEAEISQKLEDYYMQQYYPSQSELSELESLVSAYAESRNGETKYGNAEDVCLLSTSVAVSPCDDVESCVVPAYLTCSRMGGSCDVYLFAEYISEYVNNLEKLDEHNSNALGVLESFEFERIYSDLADLKNELDDSEIYANNILESKLMYPENISECPDCLGLCPLPPFDFDSLDDARGMSMSLRRDATPIANFGSFLNSILVQTEERLEYKAKECDDGTKHGTCSGELPKYCSEAVLVDKASICGCPEGFEISGEGCIEQIGCEYNNPPCNESYNCINNTCVLKPGCEYRNPPCGQGEECIENECYETCGVNGELVNSTIGKLMEMEERAELYSNRSFLISRVHAVNRENEKEGLWLSIGEDYSEIRGISSETIALLESYGENSKYKCELKRNVSFKLSEIDAKLNAINSKLEEGEK